MDRSGTSGSGTSNRYRNLSMAQTVAKDKVTLPGDDRGASSPTNT